MKKILLLLFILAGILQLNAQNVGIGTITPTEKLQVSDGNIGLFNTTDTKNWRFSYVQAQGRFSIQEDGSSRLSIANGGSVGIGTIVPNTKAILDIGSTTKGVLFPRMTTSQRLTISPVPNGLMVYDIDRNELQQYDGTAWSAILNGNYWIRPINNRNRITNPNDSIGIGTNSPTEWLDVNGNIRSRNNLIVDNGITATGSILGGAVTSTGNVLALGTGTFNGNLTSNSNLSIAGTSLLTGDVTTNSDLIINNSAAIMQLKSASVNKGFFQLSGNDVRFGTNGGNTTGNVILRMDGVDMIDYFKGANGIVMRMNNGAGANTGIIQTITQGNRFLINNPIANGTVELGGEVFILPTLNRTGVGTSTPSERLHVNGNTLITGTAQINGKTTLNGKTIINASLDVYDTIATAHVYANSLELGNGFVAPGYDGLIAAGYGTEVYGSGSAAIGQYIRVIDDLSYGIGTNVTISGRGTIALTDGTGAQFTADIDNRMYMRFNGGYRLWTDQDRSTGVLMNNGSNAWSTISDSTKKENFLYADGNLFLKKIATMKLGSWNYKTQDKKTFRHYGPMAQEFDANFGNDGIGKIGNDTTIATADIDGVIMIALQALVKENDTLKSNYEKQSAEINKLKENEKALLQRLQKIEVMLTKNETITAN